MAEAPQDLLEIVLRDVAATGDGPWYPSAYTQATGVPRDALDACLDRLRESGLVRLTDWVQGRGQGYLVTPEGRTVLENGRLLARLLAGKELPPQRTAPSGQPSAMQRGSAWHRGEEIRNSLLDPPRPVVTQTLLFLNVAAFLLGLLLASQRGVFSEYFSLNSQGLAGQRVSELRHELGTLSVSDLTERGEWWRLLGHCFVHLGLIHLLMNMWVLHTFGSLMEVMWGHWRFLLLYLVSGLCGGVLQLVADPHVRGMGGASGALCGLMASFAVWVAMNRSYLQPQVVSAWGRSIALNIFLIVFISLMPQVSWAGHLGGGVGGLLVSVPLNYNRYGHGARALLGLLGVLAVPALALGVLLNSLAVQQRLDPSHGDVIDAAKNFGVQFRAAEKIAFNLREDVGRPFLEGKKSPKKGDKDTMTAALLFRAAGQSLGQTADELRAVAAQYGGQVGAHLRGGAAVLEAQSRYYVMFAAALEDPDGWNDDKKEELKELWRQADLLDSPLRDSPVLRPQDR